MTWHAEPGELHLIADRLCERTRPCRHMIESAIEPMFASHTLLDRAIRYVLLGDAKRVRSSPRKLPVAARKMRWRWRWPSSCCTLPR